MVSQPYMLCFGVYSDAINRVFTFITLGYDKGACPLASSTLLYQPPNVLFCLSQYGEYDLWFAAS